MLACFVPWMKQAFLLTDIYLLAFGISVFCAAQKFQSHEREI
jgi:hypothetical protein